MYTSLGPRTNPATHRTPIFESPATLAGSLACCCANSVVPFGVCPRMTQQHALHSPSTLLLRSPQPPPSAASSNSSRSSTSGRMGRMPLIIREKYAASTPSCRLSDAGLWEAPLRARVGSFADSLWRRCAWPALEAPRTGLGGSPQVPATRPACRAPCLSAERPLRPTPKPTAPLRRKHRHRLYQPL